MDFFTGKERVAQQRAPLRRCSRHAWQHGVGPFGDRQGGSCGFVAEPTTTSYDPGTHEASLPQRPPATQEKVVALHKNAGIFPLCEGACPASHRLRTGMKQSYVAVKGQPDVIPQ